MSFEKKIINKFVQDEIYMHKALKIAEKAYRLGEVPVGAILVEGDSIIAEEHNLVQKKKNALAHAELLVLEKGFAHIGEKYLTTATLYVTLEPCPMCAMACAWSQVSKIVYGASDPKRGYTNWDPSFFPKKIDIISGILAEESSTLLQSFFREIRKKNMKNLTCRE